MRFIAVFSQRHTTYGLGFDTLTDATDFLFWGYEDNDLIPFGVYDVLTTQTRLYDHFGKLTDGPDPEAIRQFATAYLDRISQSVGAYDQ
ncbi:hypothetical protein [Spirosoma validum]|uniref:Uncharacterized protein n=1 Tax=Spirosoma validum TaxID=2771355 RepID=A0A927GGL7_9BACT|nr:hypothetical protein [Spirosoma validum]MBD2756745.1 hypothetical protein [Spirosoma validum]